MPEPIVLEWIFPQVETQWMLPPAGPGPVAAVVGPPGPTDPNLIKLPSELSALLGGSQTLTEALIWMAQNGGGSPSPILRQLVGNIVFSSSACGALSVEAAEQILLTGAISSASAASGSLTVGAASSIALVGSAVSTSSLTGAMTVVTQVALAGTASVSSAVAGSLTVATDVVGGVAVGSAGQAGTIYSGYTLADGDDFNTTTANDFLTPTNNAGAYMTTRHYGVQSGAPRGLRYANSLAGYEVDPWHPGFKNANRGVPLSSYSDMITYGGGTLKTKTRVASAGEKTAMGTVSKNLLSSMVHMARRNIMRAPMLMEMRLRFPYAIASWDQNHPTFWIIQSQPGNGFDGLELDCEGFTPALQFNRNTWNNGTGQFGPTLGTTQAVSKTAYRNYAFEIVQEAGLWVVKLWEDGVLVGSGSPDYGGNTFDPTRPFHLMMTSHALSGEVASVWTAAGTAGAEMECDYWRSWAPTTGVYRKPLLAAAQYLANFNTAFSFSLPTPAEVWGVGVATDVIEMIPNEDNSPAQPWVRGLLPASVTRTGNTLAGTISDQPGRLVLARSYTPAAGDGCRPQAITICIGPRVTTSTISVNAGATGTYDLYAQCDFGDLSVGATVSVTGLPAWATFNPTTGLVSYVAPGAASSTAISVTATNGMGQSVTAGINLTVAATVTSFTDDFNRANENLEASASWTRLDGTAGAVRVTSNALSIAVTDTAGAAYVSPDLGSANHYVECRILDVNQQFIGCRITDRNNFFGFRRNAGNAVEVYTRIGGTFTLVATHGTALSTDVMRLEVNGSAYNLKKNGASVGTGAIPAGVPTSTRCGLIARNVTASYIDDFAAGLT